VAHKVKPAQVERLLEEAIARYMPEEAEAQRRAAWDQRHFTIDLDSVGIAGTGLVTGELDLADALDLDQAVRTEAHRQADLGSTLTLDQRRAVAVGVIARRDLTLDYPTEETTPGSAMPAQAAKSKKQLVRRTVLHLHLSESAVRGASDHQELGRVENTRAPVTADQIREWCSNPHTQVIVKPVVDLADHVSVEAYEIPDRIAEAVALRDVSCAFPWCTRPARKLRPDEHAADCDHLVPHAEGGPTCSCQIAPLCRRHHRLKTHGGWTYRILEPGSYVWTSPHRYQYLRDHTGTLDISRDKHHCQRDKPPADT
jgi:hypothetical protein